MVAKKKATKATKKTSLRASSRSSTEAPKRAPKKATKKVTKKATNSAARTLALRSPRDRRKLATDYDKRNLAAQAKGYESYWDERQSRARARRALADLDHPTPQGQDKPTLHEVDELGTLGRGGTSKNLFRLTRAKIEEYQLTATDQEVWALIRVFYRPQHRSGIRRGQR